MILTLKSLTVNNAVLFKRVDLNLDTGQILVVRGQNRKSSDPDDSNATGKSRLMNFIPTVLYGMDPLKTKASLAGAMFDGLPSEISLILERDGVEYLIHQTNKGSSTKYKIYKDNVDQEVRTVAIAKDYIAKIWPISYDEYFSIWNLNSQVFPILQRGTPAARLDFFTRFFELDFYDDMRAYFRKRLRAIEDEAIEMGAYETQLLTDRKDLKSLGKLEDDPDDVSTEYERLNSIFTKIDEQQTKVSVINGILVQRDSLISTLNFELDIDFKSRRVVLLKRKDKVEEQAKLQQKTDRLSDELQWVGSEVTNFKSELTKQMETIKDVSTLAELRTWILDFDSTKETALRDAVRKTDTLVDRLTRDKLKQDRVKAALDLALTELNMTEESVVNTASDHTEDKMAADRTLISMYKTFKSHAQHDEDSCPVCGSDVDVDKLKSAASTAQKRLKEFKSRAKVIELIEDFNSFDTSGLSSAKVKASKLQKRLNRFTQLKDQVVQAKTSFKAFNVARKQLKTLEIDFEALPEVEDLAYTIETITEELSQISSDNKTRKTLSQLKSDFRDVSRLDFDDVEQEQYQVKLTALRKKSLSCAKKLKIVSEKKAKIEVHQAKVGVLRTKMKETKAKIATAQKKIEDKPIYEALIRAYSSKGIKLLRVKAISNIIVQNLNRYRHLLFQEPFVFSCEIQENVFDLTVDRGNGMISDVRMLSTSEGNRFNLLLMLSLLPLTRNRTSMIIMDEMDSGFSEVNRRLFREDFLPKLHSVIQNLIVVTPDNATYPNAVDLTVVKTEDGSHVRCATEGIVESER